MENILIMRNMAKESLFEAMGMSSKGTLKKEKSQDAENFDEKLEKNTSANGLIIKCMGLENSNGRMEKFIKDFIRRM